MECDEPIEVTPGMQLSGKPDAMQSPLQHMVHAEVQLTRSSIASRESVCQAVETFLRAKSGTCNLPAQLESGDFTESTATKTTFIQENVASINVCGHLLSCIVVDELCMSVFFI